MKACFLIAFSICIASGAATGQDRFPTSGRSAQEMIRVAMICFKTGEKISGMNKICFYNCLGSEAAITISSVQLCPLSIEQ